MKNISFDNPYWLLLLIPLALGVFIPYFIAIRKENKSKSGVASLIIHILIIALVTLGAAGTVISAVMTQTEVVVVADLSYSADRGEADIDRYISEIEAGLPKNSKLAVVCFGKNYVLHTDFGEEIKSVSGSDVDDSATDITSAIEYAGTLFGEDVIKRVILLTDGAETVSENVTGMVSAVERLAAQNIAIDAIYLDSNLKEQDKEVQLTGVDYTEGTYINHDTTADVLVQSAGDARAVVTLSRDGEKLTDKAVELTAGYNVINFDLPTASAGTYGYEVRVSSPSDRSEYNNSFSFTQRVSGEINVFLLTSQAQDIDAAAKLFGENSHIQAVIVNEDHRVLKSALEKYADSDMVTVAEDPGDLPYSVEELVKYDEIVLSSIDVRTVNNVTAFIESVETVVSQYGKSLVTIGDTKIQNKTDETLESLENMLPLKFGNSAQDPKLYTIVIDTSRSMYSASRFAVAKQAAVHLLTLLNDEDDVIVVTFAGDIKIIQPTTKASNREDIAKKINAMTPSQGTSIGGGLAAAVNLMINQNHDQKQVMLISDGMNYTAEIVEIEGVSMKPFEVAEYMASHDITVSTMNPYNSVQTGITTLKNIASNGGGEYYYIESEKALAELVFGDVGNDLTESVVEKESLVHIKRTKDDVVDGVSYLPSVMGYVHSKAKVSANTVLTVDYTKVSGDVVEVPLYAYWDYGNGRVSSFTGAISGAWASSWQGESAQTFLSNVTKVNVPEEKIDRPYSVNIDYDGIYANIEIIPALLDPYATVNVRITHPDGSTDEKLLTFDALRYFHRFEAPALGRYGISITYKTEVGEFTSDSDFHISYSPEYNSFENFDASTLHAMVRHRGSVSEGSIPSLENKKENVALYRLTFIVPFMIVAVALYVLDIIIRKIKWNDIKGLFKRSAKYSK